VKLSIFTDELASDATEALPAISGWGMHWVDLRSRIFTATCETLDNEQLRRLCILLDKHGLRVACLQTSLAKIHLPDRDVCAAESKKLDGIIRTADAVNCRLVRSFFYYQRRKGEDKPYLNDSRRQLQSVLDRFGPLRDRARSEGLVLAFENCGVKVEECFTVLDALDMPEWGIAWDCFNEWNGTCEPPDEESMRQRYPRTRCVHVKAYGIVNGVAETEVPWRAILAGLTQNAYDGPVSIETHYSDESTTRMEMSKRVLERLQALWPDH